MAYSSDPWSCGPAPLAWRRPRRLKWITPFVLDLVVTTFMTVDVLPVMAAATLFGVLENHRAAHDAEWST